MRIEVNKSDYAIEGVLLMKCEDKRWKLVVFLSKSLNETEKNYEIHNKEILVAIRRLENQRYLLKGTKFKFKVWTDYKNLEYFMEVQKLNKRKACWTLYLSRFDFTLKHMPNSKIRKINELSR